MEEHAVTIGEHLAQRGISRRQFLKFCGLMTATLALPSAYLGRVAQALTGAPRPRIIWLEFQDCTGDSESFLRAARYAGDPNSLDIDTLLLDTLSVDYHETLMAPSGIMSEKSLNDTITQYKGQYICIVEGSIPMANNGVYCTIRGRSALSIVRQVAGSARATIAVGSCAFYGGLAAAGPNTTGAVGVGADKTTPLDLSRGAVPGLPNLVNLPGCPMNVVNLTATIVHLLTFNALPDVDRFKRPYFAYGNEIHEECERHDHFEEGRFVLAWGDQGHKNGWCLRKMGCRGPETRHNCPTIRWNAGTNWPIGAGHGCIGCSEQNFWDKNSPIYVALPGDD